MPTIRVFNKIDISKFLIHHRFLGQNYPSIILGKYFYQKGLGTRAIMTSSTNSIEECKANAARSAVDDNIDVSSNIF